MTTTEAARYVGFHAKTVERMARAGEIPAHPVSGVRRKTWRFYPSELDAWLRARIPKILFFRFSAARCQTEINSA